MDCLQFNAEHWKLKRKKEADGAPQGAAHADVPLQPPFQPHKFNFNKIKQAEILFRTNAVIAAGYL